MTTTRQAHANGERVSRLETLTETIFGATGMSMRDATETAAQVMLDPVQKSIVEAYATLVDSIVDHEVNASAEDPATAARMLSEIVTERTERGVWTQWSRQRTYALATIIRRAAERSPS
jgi:hypothetical protein